MPTWLQAGPARTSGSERPASKAITDPATAIRPGDLILFGNNFGTALQQVTGTDGQTVFFAAGDDFNLNQRAATEGSIVQLRTDGAFPAGTSAMRVTMLTYYVDPYSTPGAPRLVRVVNRRSPRALTGVVEDPKMTYDLVDGVPFGTAYLWSIRLMSDGRSTTIKFKVPKAYRPAPDSSAFEVVAGFFR